MAQLAIKIIHRIVYYICFVGMIVFLVMMLLTTGDVIGRGILNMPIPGAYELTSYMLSVIVLLGLGYSQQIDQHVRVEVLVNKLSPRGQLILNFMLTLVGIIFFGLVIWQGWLFGLKGVHVKTTSDILRVPTYPFQFLVALGAFLFVVESIMKLAGIIKRLRAAALEHKESKPEVLPGLD